MKTPDDAFSARVSGAHEGRYTLMESAYDGKRYNPEAVF